MAKEVNKRINVWLNQQGIENNLKSVRAAIAKTTNELAKLPMQSEEWYAKSKKLGELKKIYSDMRKEINLTGREIDTAGEKTGSMIYKVGAIGAAYTAASAALQRFISSTQEYVDAYASLDDAMTNVSKYTGLSREEVRQLNDEFKKMDTRTPTERLNALAADAGRLGITSREAILEFVQAADLINVALGEDLGEDAVKEIGKLADMFGTTDTMGLRGAMLATGSAINTLAQSSSASERYLMDFTSRLAGAANQAGMSQADILGFASVLDQNKQQVEMSATAMQKLLMNMFTAPEKYARLAGMSVQEFADALKNDANEALLAFLDTLNRKGGLSELAPIFKELGLDGARASGVISVLAGKIDDVRTAQSTANEAFNEGVSVINEAAAVNGNAAAQLDKAKNAVRDANAALGEELIPVLTKLTSMSASGIQVVATAVRFMKEHKTLIASLAAAYGLLYAARMKDVAAAKLSSTWTKLVTAGETAGTTVTSLFALAKAKLTRNTLAAAAAQKALKAAFASTPWGAIITAAMTLGTAFLFFRDKSNEAAEAQKDLTVQIEQQYNTEKKKVEELQRIIESETSTREQKLQAINKLKSIIPGYVAELDKEGKVVNNNRKAIDDYLKSLKNKIRYDSIAGALSQAQNKQIELESNLAFLTDKAKNGGIVNAIWMEIKNDMGKAQDAVNKNKQYIASLMGELDNLDLELIAKTGKNYAETYTTFNESILDSFESTDGTSAGGSTGSKIEEKRKELERYGKTLDDFARKLSTWGKDLTPSSGNEMIDELLGTERKWEERLSDAQKQMSELLDLRGELVDDGADTGAVDALIDKLSSGMSEMADMEAEEIKRALEKYQKDVDTFITSEQKSVTEATLTETERQKKAIEEKYQLEIDRIEKIIEARIVAYGEDDPEIAQLREKIKLLQKLKGQQLNNVGSGSSQTGSKNIWQQMDEFDWSKLSENWQGALDLMQQGLQEFADAAFSIYGSILQMQNNATEAELQHTQEAYEAKSAALQKQLDDGIISQKYYDAKMQKLTEEKERRERKLKHDQFAREKTANIIQSIIAGALSASQTLAQWGVPWGLIPMGIALATTAVQTAMIAAQPNPYYRGGYIRGRQYAVMGEQGDEWVASHQLLRDKNTANVIASLDEYQKGNRNALAGMSFDAPDTKTLSRRIRESDTTFASSTVSRTSSYSTDTETLMELRLLRKYLEDPRNRQATINRNILLEYEKMEKQVRETAKL